MQWNLQSSGGHSIKQRFTQVYLCIYYICVYVYMYMGVPIYRERERDTNQDKCCEEKVWGVQNRLLAFIFSVHIPV